MNILLNNKMHGIFYQMIAYNYTQRDNLFSLLVREMNGQRHSLKVLSQFNFSVNYSG